VKNLHGASLNSEEFPQILAKMTAERGSTKKKGGSTIEEIKKKDMRSLFSVQTPKNHLSGEF